MKVQPRKMLITSTEPMFGTLRMAPTINGSSEAVFRSRRVPGFVR
jgi:hypothetical protein